MPWNEVLPMDEKTRFLADIRSGLDSVAELCRRHGISRKTGYKWIRRYEEAGPAGLAERSCRPKTASELTAPHVVEALLETRERHPTWGAKKLLAYLARKPSFLATASQEHGLRYPEAPRTHSHAQETKTNGSPWTPL